MNTGVPTIAVRGGFRTLSEIYDIEEELESSGLYTKRNKGDHVLYIPTDGDYAIKKSTLWLDQVADIKGYICESGSNSGHRVVAIRDIEASPADEEDVFKYNVYMCIDNVCDVDTTDNKSIINICGHLCDILTGFYSASGRCHNNVNHMNVFMDGDAVVLGNCSLAGDKNEVSYYNAPEVLRGDASSTRSDVYSLGMWLYCKLKAFGENVFESRDRYGIKDEDIKFKADVDNRLFQVIKKAISISPEDRYATPAELKEALTKAIKPKKKVPWKPIGIVAAVVLVVALVGVYIYNSFLADYDPEADRIRGMISSGSYSLAYSEINKRGSGPDTDALIIEYIEGCMDVLDYNRAAQIIPLFSDEMFESPEYIESLIYDFSAKDKLYLLEDVFEEIYSRSDEIAEIIDGLN